MSESGKNDQDNGAGKARLKKIGQILAVAVGTVALIGFVTSYISTQVDSNHKDSTISQKNAEIERLTVELENSTQNGTDLQNRLNEFTNVHAQLCQAVNAAIKSGQYAGANDAVKASCGSTSGPLVVARPANGDKVSAATEAVGTVNTAWLADKEIWFAVKTPDEAGFHIQGNSATQSGPAKPVNGRWTSPGLLLGSTQDAGKHFDIIIIVANRDASAAFWTYLQKGAQTGSYPAMPNLPQGAEEWTRIDVVRQ